MARPLNYVVLGAGPAGVTAAEALRAADPEGRIALVGAEAHPPYSRMAIPYLLAGNIDAKGTYLRPEAGHWRKQRIDLVKGLAVKLDAKGRKLMIEGQRKPLAFDRLLIATGASPVKPKIPGLGLPGVHHCWTLEDAKSIARLAVKGQPVVLMGAGFIGSIVLEALAMRGVDLTVIEAGERMVPRMMTPKASQLLKSWCEAKGVRVLTKTSVGAVGEGPQGLSVEIGPKRKLPARLLVVAAGVAPNLGFLKGSGVKVKRGVVVDERLESSVPGIFAAGDVAESKDFSTGLAAVHAIQPTAVEHGRVAALNMTGAGIAYRGSLQMNVLDALGLISASFGAWQGVAGGWAAEALDRQAFRYLRLEFSGERLVGANLVGLTDHVGMIRGLIQSGVALGGWSETLKQNPFRLPEAYVDRLLGRVPMPI
jgi:NADPH-dependent 2,4-dienoyl-CoA reductase/sulfur reductase-like enzyme